MLSLCRDSFGEEGTGAYSVHGYSCKEIVGVGRGRARIHPHAHRGHRGRPQAHGRCQGGGRAAEAEEDAGRRH